MAQLLDQWVSAMRAGDHERAWSVSERHACSGTSGRPDDPALPYHRRHVWDSGEIAGRDVLVRCYHGLGDTIQFLRFLPELRCRARSVTVEIQPRLLPLLGDDPPADRVVAFDMAKPLPRAECDVEMMELSFALRAHPADHPPPYLHIAPAPLPPATIGICCLAGDWDETRSIPPDLLAPVCEGRDCLTLDPLPSPLAVLNPEGCPFDMARTAALVAGASLVITVDTMIAHLAGAMGRPTWLLLRHEPDWRWAPERGSSEWYPSMRLYAQRRPGDWSEVIDRVLGDLEKLRPAQGTDCQKACPAVPVSWGELIDKITILQIKQARLREVQAQGNVARELFLLDRIAWGVMENADLTALIGQLRTVNEALWDVEDALREREAAGDFGPDFIRLARSVYRQNDARAALKRQINLQLGSLLVEEKSYACSGVGGCYRE